MLVPIWTKVHSSFFGKDELIEVDALVKEFRFKMTQGVDYMSNEKVV